MIELTARLNGPFATSIDLDIHALCSQLRKASNQEFNVEYQNLQDNAFQVLKDLHFTGWKKPTYKTRRAVDYDTDDFAGVSITPSCFLECCIDLQESCLLQPAGCAEPAAGYEIKDAQAVFYDFGVGVVIIEVAPLRPVEPPQFRADVERLNAQMADEIVRLVLPKIREFQTCVSTIAASAYPKSKMGIRDFPAKIDEIKLMWLHRIYLAYCDKSEFLGHSALAECMLVRNHPAPLENASISPDWAFYPSVGCSLAVHESKTRSDGFTKLENMIVLHNAYNAAIWNQDNYLFNQILDLRSEQTRIAERKVHLAEIEKHAHGIFLISSNISSFIATFRNRVSRLSPQDTILSESICRAWRFEYQMKALEEKLSSLKEMYQITLKLMSDSEARFLNKIVLAFTLISLITFITAVVDFTVKQEMPEVVWWRFFTVALTGSLVILAGFFIFQRQFGFSGMFRRTNVNDPL